MTTSETRSQARSAIERFYEGNENVVVIGLLVFGCIVIYFRTTFFDFIAFDDNLYVYENPNVLAGISYDSLKWALTSFHATNWHPLTWLSHQLDVSLFGPSAGLHHVSNFVIHTFNSILVYFALRRLTGSIWKSAAAACIFAFHPTHVESVAWISERKDLLSALFFLVSIIVYANFTAAPKKVGWYILLLLVFGLGLAAKPMLVTFPCVLLLLDVWPLSRIESFSFKNIAPKFYEKIPLFLLAIISSIVTFTAQNYGGAVVPFDALPLSSRLANAALAYITYLWNFFFPLGLCGWYPFHEDIPVWQTTGALLLISSITLFVIWKLKEFPFVAVGWFWFVGMLVPVIGVIQVGAQSHADRYTYLPYIGLSIAVVWGLSVVIGKYRINLDVVTVIFAALMITFIVLSFIQVSTWRNTVTFYQRILDVTGRTHIAAANFCNYLQKQDRLDEAIPNCLIAIEQNPNFEPAHVTLGVIAMKQGRSDDALKSFERAAQLKPGEMYAEMNRVTALLALNRLEEANSRVMEISGLDIEPAIKLPFLFEMNRKLGFGFASEGNFEKAAAAFGRSVTIDGTRSDTRANLGYMLAKTGQMREAISELERSLEIDPAQADVHEILGTFYLQLNDEPNAIQHFNVAVRLDPNRKVAAEFLKHH